jgi:thiamine-phosphate pyrophosphorylase
MSDTSQPKVYLVSPPEIDLSGAFSKILEDILTTSDVACFRLQLSSEDEREIGKIADGMREICHVHDVAIVIERHMLLVEKFGLDGVHLTDGSKNITKARKLLGKDAIVGAFCGASRHVGLSAGEAGADYVSFGPVSGSELNDGELVETNLFDWWSQVIEVPVVAEGRLTTEKLSELGQSTDFLAFGQEIWDSEDPSEALSKLMAAAC